TKPVSTPTASEVSVAASKAQPSPAASVPPALSTSAAKPAPSPATVRSGRKPLIIGAIAAIAVGGILLLGFVGWRVLFHKSDPQKIVEKPLEKPEIPQDPAGDLPPDPGTLAKPDPQPEPKPEPRPEPKPDPKPNPATTAVASSLSKVKVPGDAATIAKAIELCKDGGTVEIAGGNYHESIQITKSISLIAEPSAVMEYDNSNVITARGPIKVTLRNLQIKNPTVDAKLPAEKSPALVVIYEGAEVHFDACALEKSTGDGVSAVKKAYVKFSNSKIRDNRGYGVNVRDASRVEMSFSDVRKNGSSGIAIMNGGSKGALDNNTTIAENFKNGVELGNGASLECKGVTINQNKQVGLVVEASGSKAQLDASCVISDNKHGIGVTNSASLVLANSKLEGNNEDGLFVESGGTVEIDNCEFKSNGPVGAYLVNGASSAMRISKSIFTSHSDAGIAVVEGKGVVSECRFSGNKMAIFYGEKSSGRSAGNLIHPGPLEEVLILEKAGDVRLENNTINPP
ncbi:MAG: right-handed parallel beta-helix repeat-containing protein, partial [Verrucomicrobiota bacterium]